MPLTLPTIDDRRYQDLLDEAIARIPVHTPEYTNFNHSDPGITLIEVFAFLTENLLYRSNLIPERNRAKFLSLLGVPLFPGSSAQGIVTFTNERGPRRTITLHDDIEVRAGQVPFRIAPNMGLDVLPIEAQVFYKRKLLNPSAEIQQYYRELYTSFLGTRTAPANPVLYETTPLLPRAATPIDLGQDTIDQSLWLALFLRRGDKPISDAVKNEVREQIAGRVLSLGIVPAPTEGQRQLVPAEALRPNGAILLQYLVPDVPDDRLLPTTLSARIPRYQPLPASPSADILSTPGTVQITLPGEGDLHLWQNIDPLESGAGDFPPNLEDSVLQNRLITWLRITAPAGVRARFQWIGINAAPVNQRARVTNELLPRGTGEPDQIITLSQKPVIRDSVRLTVTPVNGTPKEWRAIDDLYAAPAEVSTRDPRLHPGYSPPEQPITSPEEASPSQVYEVDEEAGVIRFGDGTHGARPPFGSVLRVEYDYGLGALGNLGADAITTSQALPNGLKVTNPVPTWGGADPETQAQGEKQITRYLQHRDRLVTAEDFEAIALRTPGVEIGRVEVLPAFNPDLAGGEPGDAPGAVTLMLIPRYDPAQPNAPMPDSRFLDAVCAYLDPRRLVTTEVFLRAPNYRRIWVSVGIRVAARVSIATVTDAVNRAVQAFLSPLPPEGTDALPELTPLLTAPEPERPTGWPLGQSVLRLELISVVSRVPGVVFVSNVVLFDDSGSTPDEIAMRGLDLPMLAGIAVGIGEAPPIEQIPGLGSTALIDPDESAAFVPIPIVPEDCR